MADYPGEFNNDDMMAIAQKARENLKARGKLVDSDALNAEKQAIANDPSSVAEARRAYQEAEKAKGGTFDRFL